MAVGFVAIDVEPEGCGLSCQQAESKVRNIVTCNQYWTTKSVSNFRNIITGTFFGLVWQNRGAGDKLHFIVAATRIYPDRLLHCGSNSNNVITVQGIDDDRNKVTFSR